MPNIFDSPIGRTIQQRLEYEQIIWLTTVDAQDRPQPRPVWFHWDGETLLIISQPNAAKVRHIYHNPYVALNFNTDQEGGSVGVLLGTAQITSDVISPERMQAYLHKYEAGIQGLDMTPDRMISVYSTAIFILPSTLRGF